MMVLTVMFLVLDGAYASGLPINIVFNTFWIYYCYLKLLDKIYKIMSNNQQYSQIYGKE